MGMEEVLAKLDPKTRARFVDARNYSPERQLTPSIGLNMALKGGFGYGRQTMVWGNKSAGKSSFLLQMIGMAQANGKVCAWIDAEGSFDAPWAERLGVDVDQLILSETKTIQGFVDEGKDLMEAGVDLIVCDSITTLLPASFFGKDSEELKLLNDTKQIGAHARDMTNAVNMLNYINKKTLLILISQQRKNLGGHYVSNQPTGGLAVKFNSSTVVQLRASEAEDKQIKGKVQNGDLLFEEKIGRPVDWIVDYNKLGPMGQTGTYDFYYQGEKIGVDRIGEILDYAHRHGLVERGGAWYTINGNRLQGRPKAVEYLRQNLDVATELEAKLYG